MKQAKQRVIALDYLRGICILMVVINHAWVFSMPFAYLTGAGAMWTSAAELFFLLSGATMVIVRGGTIKNQFHATARRIWRRAGIIYVFYTLLVAISLVLLYLLPAGASTIGLPPSAQGINLLWQVLTFHYSIGAASFLMYYSVFLALAPFALYLIQSWAWPLVMVASLALFILASTHIIPSGTIAWFLIWQVYFVLGMGLALIRKPIASWFRGLPSRASRAVFGLVMAVAAVSLTVSALLAFHLYPYVNSLTNSGWLPGKARGAYFHLLKHGAIFNQLFGEGRMGLLRPLAAVFFLGTICLIYARYEGVILKKTGKFVNTMGSDTLWVFAAQAVAIPVMATLPVERNIAMNFMLTSLLVLAMWSVTQRRYLVDFLRDCAKKLRSSFYEAEYTAMSRQLNE